MGRDEIHGSTHHHPSLKDDLRCPRAHHHGLTFGIRRASRRFLVDLPQGNHPSLGKSRKRPNHPSVKDDGWPLKDALSFERP